MPKPDEAARYLLDVLVQKFNMRPGEVAQLGRLIMPFNTAPWRSADYDLGVRYAMEKGWIEPNERGNIRLTQAGYAAQQEGSVVDLFAECNEHVTIEKADGKRYEMVPARVSREMVLLPDSKLPLSRGDAILRQLPSDMVSRLLVEDPGYFAGDAEMPGHYQATYRLEGTAPQGSTVNYNFHGDNARVNQNSVDMSTNSVTHGTEDLARLVTQLSTLRQSLSTKAVDAEHYVAIGAVANAEIAAKSGDRSKVMSALSALGGAGKWAFDVAKDISVDLAAKVISESMKG